MSSKYYFFCCNVRNSRILSWEINGDGIGLFDGQNLEDVIRGSTPDYSYSASLLSLRRNSSTQFVFDSVLIISAPHELEVNVGCFSDFASNSTNNRISPLYTAVFQPQINSPLVLVPLFISDTPPIVTSGNVTTGALLCGSNTSYDQSWETNTNELAFSSYSPFGTSRNILTSSRDTLRLHAISLGHHSQLFFSILYLTDGNVSEVSCIAGRSIANVSYPITSIGTTTTTTTATTEGMITIA